jgi:hypothetical protein
MNGSDNNTVKLVRFLKISWNFSSKFKILSFIYELMPRTVALRQVEAAGLPEPHSTRKKIFIVIFNDLGFLVKDYMQLER